ncbi:hypothetical protein WHR41_06356 [Cladosporium halotolerans]|uniref:Uncharacterized protein n=1 Tax=Cladosporium halotolerans TaxID=1052096 RepID=A0AB34KIA5_9PEZI
MSSTSGAAAETCQIAGAARSSSATKTDQTSEKKKPELWGLGNFTIGQPHPSPIENKTTYGWYSVVRKAVPINLMLEPDWLDLPPAEWRFQLLGNWHSVRDPWFEIRRAHPLQSELRPDVHPHLFLVAERERMLMRLTLWRCAGLSGMVACRSLKCWEG